MNRIFDRTIGLLGEDNFNKIQNKRVAIFGLGGVGGTAFEALLRSGISKFLICDFDDVDITNINRQILYTSLDVGKKKIHVASARAISINPEAEIISLDYKVDDKICEKIRDLHIDFIVDAIDDVKAKKELAKYALQRNIPFIMSMGMANKLCPTNVIITRLNKTENDPLAKKMRHDLKQEGLDISQINVVTSKENPIKNGSKLNSMMMVPSEGGLVLAYFVVKTFIDMVN